MSLSGKKALLLSPEFFGYGREIARELEQLGAEVAAYDTRPDNSTLTKIALRVAPFLVGSKARIYHQDLIHHNQPDIDYLLVIRGEGLTTKIIQTYRKHFSRAKFIYYTYDSLVENRLFFSFQKLFDHCYTFDPIDAKSYPDLVYEPLFFIPRYGKVTNTPFASRSLDVSFVGTFRADRYRSIQKVISMLPENLNTYFFFYHANPAIFKTLRMFSSQYRNADPKLVHFKSLSAEEVSSILERSKTVIDVQKPHQNGLTMRTIEMLGAQRKLITTNPWVKEHDFYDPNNIYVIEPNSSAIPAEFFSSPYKPLPEPIRNKYSLSAWLTRVLS